MSLTHIVDSDDKMLARIIKPSRIGKEALENAPGKHYIRNSPFSWTTLPVSGLSHLDIRLERGASSFPGITELSFDQFFDFLDAASILEQIRLEHCFPSSLLKPPASSSRLIQLPRLAKVTLKGEVSSLAFLSVYNNRELLPNGIHFQAWTDPDADTGRDSDVLTADGSPLNTSDFTLNLEWDGAVPSDMLPMIKAVCHGLPLEHLQKLDLELEIAEWSARQWIDTFARYPRVNFLAITGKDATVSLSEALLQNVRGAGTSQRAENLLFPVLRSLALMTASFGRLWPDRPRFYEIFCACLRNRRSYGAELHMLEIQDSDIQRAWLPHFKRVVRRVVWDGDQGDVSYESDDYSGGYW
ncbi:hypothetical protein BV25DRAFT_1920946 [Artomyces pyxidatus]|uniref:Uncharacterized protein n=1 Tax=Artomyces pyxidatus TaxID=48021 RepID=A0ACB8SJV7_9AGAM|nr:hypothetical protein BV25DRAFT_1920946 [Artomyces pyxidatus]